MRSSWFRGLAVGAASAALAVAPVTAAVADPRAHDPADAVVGPAAPLTSSPIAVWQPGALAKALRQEAAPGARYSAVAERLTTVRRADALVLAHAALEAARAVQELQDAVDAATAERLGEGVVRLAGLLDGSRFSGVDVHTAPGAVQIPDADVAPARVQPQRDLELVATLEDAAADVFRLSIQVEVAAQEAQVGDPIGGPGDLRALAGLTPVEEEATGDGLPGRSAADDPAGAPEAGAPTDRATGAAAPVAPASEGRPAQASPVAEAPVESGVVPKSGVVPENGAPAVGAPAPAGAAPEAPGTSAAPEAPAAGALPEAGAAPEAPTEPASLDALPAELVDGLTALEAAVAAAGDVLAGDILGLDAAPGDVYSAQLLALAQGLDAGDVAAWSRWRNGRVPLDELCPVVFTGDVLLRCDAAAALEILNAEYRAEFGEDLGVVSAYRSYGEQVSVKANKGWLAATPGTSNHGWGVAVDLAGMGGLGQYSSPRYRWMLEHGPAYGWHHPLSMRPGGGGPPEPWHFEFGLGAGHGETGAARDEVATPALR